MTLGERIKESRENKGYMQSQLAEMIGVKSASIISNWEKDINKPDADKLVKLCSVLGVTAAYLLDYYGKPSESYSDEALDLARKYDAIGDEHARNVIRTVVNLEYEHHARPNTLPTSEWLLAHAINAPDAEDQAHSG